MKTFFSSGKAYPWTTGKNVCFRGYFIVDGRYFHQESAIAYLAERFSQSSPETVLRELNGVFSIIWEGEHAILFAVDRLRGLPLFYTVEKGELWLGDDVNALAENLPRLSMSSFAEQAYLSAKLFVPGRETLLQNVFQVQGGGFCLFSCSENRVEEHVYFSMEHKDFFDEAADLPAAFHRAYGQAGKNLVRALNGRTAVVPLSGGADSRMVLSMLKEAGYEKVICFTYGAPGNAESEISRRVAAEYGYPWLFVPYTKQMWRDYRADPVMAEYERFGFAYSSTPHLQDFPAVQQLKQQGALPEDSVFVPGHSGDMIAGSHVAKEFLGKSMSRAAFLEHIQSHFFGKKAPVEMASYLDARFPVCPEEDMEAMASQSEWFNAQERQAKFIVNSVRVYEFFGYEWLIPLWDNALFEFWKRVPLPLRYQRTLYFSVVQDHVPSTNSGSPVKSLAATVRQIPGVRNVIRRTVRMLRYLRSPLLVENYIAIPAYFWGCIHENATFEVNNIICKQMIQQACADIQRHEKT